LPDSNGCWRGKHDDVYISRSFFVHALVTNERERRVRESILFDWIQIYDILIEPRNLACLLPTMAVFADVRLTERGALLMGSCRW